MALDISNILLLRSRMCQNQHHFPLPPSCGLNYSTESSLGRIRYNPVSGFNLLSGTSLRLAFKLFELMSRPLQIVAAFVCDPIDVVWKGGFGGPKCINILALNYYNAAFNITTDILLAAAPIAVIKGLQMDKSKKGWFPSL